MEKLTFRRNSCFSGKQTIDHNELRELLSYLTCVLGKEKDFQKRVFQVGIFTLLSL